MLNKKCMATQPGSYISGGLYIVFILSALALEVELFRLPVFPFTQNLSTAVVAMTLGMLAPFFFPADFFDYAKTNRLFLLLAVIFLISGFFSAIYSPFSKAYAVKGLVRYAYIIGSSFVLVFLCWLKPRLSLFFLKTVACITFILGVISIIEANNASVATWLADFFRHGQCEMIQGRFRPSATVFHPNILGCLMSIGVLILVCLKVYGHIGRILFFLSISVLGMSIAFASSRNSIIALTVPLFFLLFNRTVVRTSLIALLLIAACIIANPASTARIFGLDATIEIHPPPGTSGYHFVETRLLLWESAARMLRDHPVLGIGPGRYNEALKTYAPKNLPETEMHKIDKQYLNAHNGMLNLLAEFGLAGALSAALIFLVLCGNIFTSYRLPPFQPAHAIILGFVISFLSDAFFYSFFYMILFVSIALMFSNKKCAPFLNNNPG